MKRPTKAFSRQEVALFPTMIDVTEPSTSPSRITSSPSPSPEPSPSHLPEHSRTPSPTPEHIIAAPSQPSPTHPSPIQPSPRAEHHLPTPNESLIHAVHLHGSDEGRLKLMNLNDEDIADDSSKQGRILSDAEVQEKARSAKVSTAGAKQGTASEEVPIVSTAEKKSKKELEQERLSLAEAIRLEEQMNEEQKAQIARDEEIARQWDEEERQRAMAEVKTSKKIDWNDPSVIRYHTQKMKPKTVAQARKNMIKYLKNQGNYKISDFKGMSLWIK
ncbi:hypothetical protein Tco_1406295 [Tanacetum coccineum]